jgi:nucleoside-diphosphate-sugar epimerase
MSKNVLIIGGNGYIGSRIIYDLESIYQFSSVDICWFGKDLGYNLKTDYKLLTKEYFSKFDVIILLAGHSSVKMCDGDIHSSWNNNINNFVNLVKKLDKSQLLIYASSGSVYGSNNIISKEDIPLEFKPINYYDLTKYTVDVHVNDFIKEGYQIVGFRFGTVNGWSPNIREELMINSMTQRSIEKGILSINNKSISRPILGIADISKAIDTTIKNPISGIYNLASFCSTVKDISNSVSKILSSKIIETPDINGAYDFLMSVEKFTSTYDFKFQESVDTIVTEIINNIDQTTFSNRNQFIKYG